MWLPKPVVHDSACARGGSAALRGSGQCGVPHRGDGQFRPGRVPFCIPHARVHRDTPGAAFAVSVDLSVPCDSLPPLSIRGVLGMGLLSWLTGTKAPAVRPPSATSGGTAALGVRSGTGSPGFAVIDVETTGLSANAHRIIELAVVRTDRVGRIVEEWVCRFNPDCPVGATHVHGISDADVVGAPHFADVLPEITHRLTDVAVAGHNVRFDLAFLRSEYARAGWRFRTCPPCAPWRRAGRSGRPSTGGGWSTAVRRRAFRWTTPTPRWQTRAPPRASCPASLTPTSGRRPTTTCSPFRTWAGPSPGRPRQAA